MWFTNPSDSHSLLTTFCIIHWNFSIPFHISLTLQLTLPGYSIMNFFQAISDAEKLCPTTWTLFFHWVFMASHECDSLVVFILPWVVIIGLFVLSALLNSLYHHTLVTKPGSFCLPHDIMITETMSLQQRKGLSTRWPREETREQISSLLPWKWGLGIFLG